MINRVLLVLTILGLCMSGVSLWMTSTALRVAYVNADQLVYGYAGMVDAQSRYRIKAAVWEQEVDSLEQQLRTEIRQAQTQKVPGSIHERNERMQQLLAESKALEQRRNTLQENARKEDAELTSGVLARINDFASEYAQREGYDLIICATPSNPVLHGDNALDLTVELLRELNHDYKNGGRGLAKAE